MKTTGEEGHTSCYDELFQKWKIEVLSINENAAVAEETEKTNSDLQQESRSFFECLTVKYEEVLAKLIRDLSPAFTSTNLPTRLRGMYVLFGALEGCRDKNISNSCLALLGDFLTLQCGPIVDDEYEEDYDSMIRDISINCLSVLVGTPTTTMVSDGKEFTEALERRVNLAKKGVELRCAVPDDMYIEDQADTENDNSYYKKDIRGGLSRLPRSKRSLCFALLDSAVLGTSKVSKPSSLLIRQQMHQQQSESFNSVQSHLVQFADFTARCIHGESDPRCLLQLLQLLHHTQLTFCDWFRDNNTYNPTLVFPHEDYFDAVAPYYPIQFTPPPNNVHGITREGLHSALISVLSFTEMDEPARRYRKPTMLGCSLNLFLEQLLPVQSNEEKSSPLEKLESLECISRLLFPTRNQENKQKQTDGMKTECLNLSLGDVENLSTALIGSHDEASVAVSHGTGDLCDQNKVLAESCRNLASRVARELENPQKDESNGLWLRFVSEPLDREMQKLKLTPAYARTSIAYEASLATSGGPRTLRICLAKGLDALLGYLREHIKTSDDNTLAAIRGVAAFISSSQVAVSKSRNEGVELTPHPLQPFAEETCDLLLTIVESKVTPHSRALKIAAASCLECLFRSSPQKDLDLDELLKRICNFLKGLLETTLIRRQNDASGDDYDFVDYQFVSSQTIGRIVGVSSTECDDKAPNCTISKSILSAQMVQDCLQNEIFPKLKAAAFDEADGYNGERYDRLALSTACSSSTRLASSVIGSHLETLLHGLKHSTSSRSVQECLAPLSYILRSCVGDNVINSFHENDVVDEILDVLCDDVINSASAQIRDSISQVALSPTTTTTTNNEIMKSKIESVIQIERALLPAYRSLVPRERLKKLLKAISDKFPPLSKADEGVLLVRLPILSTALEGAESSLLEEVVSEININDGPPVSQLLQDLTEYVLSDDHISNSARNAGASCVHSLLKSGFNRNLDCPTEPLLVDVNKRILSPSISLIEMKNCLNYLSLLGSASALRGASSSSTADTIASFLSKISCEGFSRVPFSSGSEDEIFELSKFFEERYSQTAIRLVSSSAHGAIMLEDGMKPLMIQRLTHNIIKYIKKLSDRMNDPVKSTSPSETGLLLVVCNVVCACDPSKFDQATTRLLAAFLVEGLTSDLFQPSSQLGGKMPAEAKNSRIQVISALLKFLCICPTAFDAYVLEIVSGLLRSYAISDPSSEVGCKLISLQTLQAVSRLDESKESILAVKPAVIALLSSAMSQKNGLLRSAAVDVRNAWCLAA